MAADPRLDAAPIGKLLAKEVEKGRTLKDISELSGVGSGTIGDVINGRKTTVSLTQAENLLVYLDVPLELLYPYGSLPNEIAA
jgi:transcriptional regulator with XRE-family HTH domain